MVQGGRERFVDGRLSYIQVQAEVESHYNQTLMQDWCGVGNSLCQGVWMYGCSSGEAYSSMIVVCYVQSSVCVSGCSCGVSRQGRTALKCCSCHSCHMYSKVSTDRWLSDICIGKCCSVCVREVYDLQAREE